MEGTGCLDCCALHEQPGKKEVEERKTERKERREVEEKYTTKVEQEYTLHAWC